MVRDPSIVSPSLTGVFIGGGPINWYPPLSPPYYISAHVSAGVARAVCERAGNPPRAARSQTRADDWRGTTRLVAGGPARACGPRAGRHHSSRWSPACRRRVVNGDGRVADDLNGSWLDIII